MEDDIERFIADNNRLRILRTIGGIRLVSSIEVPAWPKIKEHAEGIFRDADIPTLTREEFLAGNLGDAMLLIKWGLPSSAEGIAQLLLFAEMQNPVVNEMHVCVVWMSQSLLLIDLNDEDEIAELLLNEIREFASAHKKACSFPD